MVVIFTSSFFTHDALAQAFNEDLNLEINNQSAVYLGASGFEPGTIEHTFVGIVYFALTFSGVALVAIIVYGGYLWLTAAGNDEQIKKAKDVIKSAIIGIVIILSGYAVSYAIIKAASFAITGKVTERTTL